MFGLRPFAGRLIAPSDDVRGAAPVAVMSYRAWQQHFGADPSVVGSAFIIDGAPFTLVGNRSAGILRRRPAARPARFLDAAGHRARRARQRTRCSTSTTSTGCTSSAAPNRASSSRAWKPKSTSSCTSGSWRTSRRPTPATGRDSNTSTSRSTPAGGGLAEMRENYEHDLRLLMGITGLVLLIACANLANLQLARGAAQSAQMSIRVALGAPRSRLIRQVLTESMLLAVAGGAVGLLVAIETRRAAGAPGVSWRTYVPIDSTPSLPVLGFTFLLSVVTGVVFGIAPAWSASRADPAAALRGAGRSASGRSTLPQKTLVVLQAALSLVLLAGAGLMVADAAQSHRPTVRLSAGRRRWWT